VRGEYDGGAVWGLEASCAGKSLLALPSDYLAILEYVARACLSYRDRSGSNAILVGGAATALYTDGMFPSADFDLVAGRDQDFADAMMLHGFKPEDRPGHLLVGFYHPDFPGYGVQQVTPPLFDGRSDLDRVVRLAVVPFGELVLPSVEDLIADRLAQHSVASPTDNSRLNQAKALFALAPSCDRDYLLRRIIEEGGDPSLIGIGAREGQEQP